MKKEFTGRLFTASDLHINHQNILQYCENRGSSVEEMNEMIVSNWNALITPEDRTIIVGDVAMGKIAEAPAIIRRLNGSKILVRGNHDKSLYKLIQSDYQQYSDLFETMTFQYEMTHKVDGKKHQIVFSHYPYWAWSGQDRGVMNLFGHLHSIGDQRFISDYRQMDVGIDGNDLKPYLLDDVVRLLEQRPLKQNHHIRD